jgi:hypothetical protein
LATPAGALNTPPLTAPPLWESGHPPSLSPPPPSRRSASAAPNQSSLPAVTPLAFRWPFALHVPARRVEVCAVLKVRVWNPCSTCSDMDGIGSWHAACARVTHSTHKSWARSPRPRLLARAGGRGRAWSRMCNHRRHTSYPLQPSISKYLAIGHPYLRTAFRQCRFLVRWPGALEARGACSACCGDFTSFSGFRTRAELGAWRAGGPADARKGAPGRGRARCAAVRWPSGRPT